MSTTLCTDNLACSFCGALIPCEGLSLARHILACPTSTGEARHVARLAVYQHEQAATAGMDTVEGLTEAGLVLSEALGTPLDVGSAASLARQMRGA